MDIRRLRSATAADHDAVEAAVPLMSSAVSLPVYMATLRRMYGVVEPWERFAEATAPAELLPMVLARARRQLLEQDLLFLSGELPEGIERSILPAFVGRAELLGAMYVMEGSRLGGQLLARHAEERLGLKPMNGTAYFRGFGDRTGVMWKQVVAVLEAEVSLPEEEAVIAAARRMFAVFGDWMRGVLPSGTDGSPAPATDALG